MTLAVAFHLREHLATRLGREDGTLSLQLLGSPAARRQLGLVRNLGAPCRRRWFASISRTPPPGVLNGIAQDPATDRLFVTGTLWPKLFVIRVQKKG